MPQLFAAASPFDEVHVALDLETTGLDAQRDTIIEVGAVKFRGEEVIDTFQTLVNPGRPIPEFIQRLTGIGTRQVQRAPFFASVAGDLRAFLGNHPIIGHNISFDLGFLASHGLNLDNVPYDTWDLASAFLPRTMDYSLSRLITHLGGEHSGPHRALDDARATQAVFLALLHRAADMDAGLLRYITNLAKRSRWAIAAPLEGLYGSGSTGDAGLNSGTTGLMGLDLEGIGARIGHHGRRGPSPTSLSRLDAGDVPPPLDESATVDMLGQNGVFARAFDGFEHRAEQVAMLAAVTKAIYRGEHLVVEGGTGVGKSMAYLLPAVLFAVARGQRVVISTNTINLQEQLMRKDIPALVKVLEEQGVLDKGLVRAALLKGRANYLCLRRWSYLARSESPAVEDARLLSKTAVWLRDTVSGDRGEINLSGRDAFTWGRISAEEKGRCPGLRDDGPCFLRSARERAEQAHVLVVNHALLLSDLVRGGGVIPEYKYLVIDEAHNLEEEATRQLGFQIAADRLGEDMELQGRLITRLRMLVSAETLASPMRQQGETAIAEAEGLIPRLRDFWGRLWTVAEQFVDTQRQGAEEPGQVLLTRGVRAQSAWSEIELAWENVDVALEEGIQRLARLQRFLEAASLPEANDPATLVVEVSTLQDNLRQLQAQLKSIIGTVDEGSINWIGRDGPKDDITLHAAPLEVGTMLAAQLFPRKECVILTSATLSSQSNFEYLKGRVGVPQDSAELLVGSPFDYRRAALLLIPEDMPEPMARGYLESLSRVLIDLGQSLRGRTMALFTSHAALRGASQQVRGHLQAEGIQVLAQGVDGSAQQLMHRFAEDPRSILLGTSSFWEGVDWPSGVLKALVLTRLPFQVPTDPIVAARSAQYGDPFRQYTIPQAVLRFRQGMGRLIRNKGDKGTIVVLDRRITGRGYGQAFLQSMPPCTLKPSSLATVGALAAQWIDGGHGPSR